MSQLYQAPAEFLHARPQIVAFLELSQLILERRYFGITDADLVGLSPSMRTSPICAHINTLSAHYCAIEIQSGI